MRTLPENTAATMAATETVSYRFNKWATTCSHDEGEDCLTAAVKDLMSWSVPEYVRVIAVPSDSASPHESVFRVEMYYPGQGTTEPIYSAALHIPHSEGNLAIDAASARVGRGISVPPDVLEIWNSGSLFLDLENLPSWLSDETIALLKSENSAAFL